MEKFNLEEIKEIEKQRVLSNAELLKGGAEYEIDERGNKRLDITDGQIDNIKNAHEREIEEERQRLLYEYVQQQGFERGDKIKVRFLPNQDNEISWSFINPELTRHGIKTGDERTFYLTAEPVYADCMIASVVPIEQLSGTTNKDAEENSVRLWYRDIESVEKMEG